MAQERSERRKANDAEKDHSIHTEWPVQACTKVAENTIDIGQRRATKDGVNVDFFTAVETRPLARSDEKSHEKN